MRLTRLVLSSFLHFHPHSHRWPDQLRDALIKGCPVLPNFITPEEEQSLLEGVEPRLKRQRYETTHWDDAIYLYRERELREWSEQNEAIIGRVLKASFPPGTNRSSCILHALDLHKDGHIKPHIDSKKYCGDVVSGISLLSDCVMRLRHEEHKDELVIDLYLPRRSLYKLSGPGRFEFTHEILPEASSHFDKEHVPRSRRISIICRDVPKAEALTREQQAEISFKPIPE